MTDRTDSELLHEKIESMVYYLKNGAQNPAYNITNDDILDLLLEIDNTIDFMHMEELSDLASLKYTVDEASIDIDNARTAIDNVKDNLRDIKNQLSDSDCVDDIEDAISELDFIESDLREIEYKLG